MVLEYVHWILFVFDCFPLLKTLTRDRRTQRKIYLQIGIFDLPWIDWNCFCKQMSLEPLRSLLGALWTGFGVLLGLSWRPFRAFLGSFGSNLAASWGQGGGPNGTAIRMAKSDPPQFRVEGPRASKRPPRTPKKAVMEGQK